MEFGKLEKVRLYLIERNAFFVPPGPGHKYVLEILPQRFVFLEVDDRGGSAALLVGNELNSSHLEHSLRLFPPYFCSAVLSTAILATAACPPTGPFVLQNAHYLSNVQGLTLRITLKWHVGI